MIKYGQLHIHLSTSPLPKQSNQQQMENQVMRADSGDFWQCFLMLETLLTFSISTEDFHSKNFAQNNIFGLMSFFVVSSRKQFSSFQKCGYRRCHFAIEKKLGNTIFRRCLAGDSQLLAQLLDFVLEIHHFCKILPVLKASQKKLRFGQMKTSTSSQFNSSRIRKLSFQGDHTLAQDRHNQVCLLVGPYPRG